MFKKIRVEDAVGEKLSHDITEIRPGEFKGTAFRKGHTVCDEDICHLQKLGKNHLYLINLEKDEIHENQAAPILAKGLAGPCVTWEDDPKEGKICLYAETDGLLVVDKANLAAFNMVDEVMCASLHSYTLVKKGQQIAATRPIPLVMKRTPVERAAAIAQQNGGIVSVHELKNSKFMVAYISGIPILGVPACGLHHKVTVLDLILPRILIGEHIGKKELAFFGHGGLCMDCPECTHPHCPFGKGM